MRKSLFAAVAAAAVAAALPASASADPPITPPEGSTCTFEAGLTTCVQSIGFGSVVVQQIDDPSCPSGIAERRTTTTSITTTTTVFRGTHQMGEPRTETTSNTTVTTTCVEPESP
jgi:hypothetical protein